METGTGITKRVDNISYNKDLSLETPMTTAKIELTGECPLNCRFCYEHTMRKNNERQKLMTDKNFDLVMDALHSIKTIKEVGLFYMGESSLHPSLAKYYEIVKKDGYFTYLTTNGVYISNTIEAIPYIDSLKVSWNYKNEADFEYKTRSPRVIYRHIKNNINELYYYCHKIGKKLSVSTVLDYNETPEDYTDILATIKYDEHYFMPVQTQCGTYKNGKGGVVGEYMNQSSIMPCWALFKGFYVDVDLNVRTCAYGHTKYHIIGNLKSAFDTEKIKLKSKHLLASGEGPDSPWIPDICKRCVNP